MSSFFMISHSRVQGCIHCCKPPCIDCESCTSGYICMPESFKGSPCRHKSWAASPVVFGSWRWDQPTGAQQSLELLEELLAATQQVKECLCVSRCNVPHDILLPCHNRNPLLTCFLGLQRHAHSFYHPVVRLAGDTNYIYICMHIYSNVHTIVLPECEPCA